VLNPFPSNAAISVTSQFKVKRIQHKWRVSVCNVWTVCYPVSFTCTVGLCVLYKRRGGSGGGGSLGSDEPPQRHRCSEKK